MTNRDVHARTTTEAQLIERAITDPAFRAELLADPKAVFTRELGLMVPDTIDVRVVEETPANVYLVLPAAVAQHGTELSETELERVAGGWTQDTAECAGTCGQNTCTCIQCVSVDFCDTTV